MKGMEFYGPGLSIGENGRIRRTRPSGFGDYTDRLYHVAQGDIELFR